MEQTFLTVASFDAKKFKNAEHVQMCTNVMAVIESAGAEAIGLLDSIYAPFCQAIETEQDIVNKAYASAFTTEMQRADEERGVIFRRVYKKLELCEVENPDSEAYKATALVKKHLIAPYKSADVLKLPYQEKTAVLTGFVQDCHDLLTSTQQSAIGIEGDLDDLSMANQKFASMYQERVSEKVVGNMLLSDVLRAVTDQAFLRVAVNLNMLCNDPSEEKAAQTLAARTAVEKINVVINEAKARVSQRLSGYACVVENVAFNIADGMPVLLNEETESRIIGRNLQPKKIVMEMVVKEPGMVNEIRSMSLAEFCEKYEAQTSTTKDPVTNFDVLIVNEWKLGEDEVTLGSITV